jgi:hypothetical protein
MKEADCHLEEAVKQAGLRREMTPELETHVRDCALCRRSHRVAAFFAEAHAEPLPQRSLPTAQQIWWKAEIIRRMTSRRELVERVGRPTLWGAGLALGTLLAAFTLALTTTAPWTSLDHGAAWPLLFGATVAPAAAIAAFWLIWRET